MKEDFSKYDLIFNLGATDDEIKSLKNTVGKHIPADYLNFLRFSNGASGMHINVYDIGIVIEYYLSDLVQIDLPGFLIFGSDGGGEAYGYNLNLPSPEIMMIPFIGGKLENGLSFGKYFGNFLQKAINPTYFGNLE